MKKLATQEVILRCNLKHNYRYDYKKTIYINKRTDIIVYCQKHNLHFNVNPRHHWEDGVKCDLCTEEDRYISLIQRANQVHSFKYDYDLVPTNVLCSQRVDIKCKVHGIFNKNFSEHINNKVGCSRCSLVLNTKDFIKKSKIIHKNKYDYSNAHYTDSKTKIKISCKTHGEFLQTSSSHLSGSGCYLCGSEHTGWSKSKFKSRCKSKTGLGIFYIIRCFDSQESFYKLGITSLDIKERFRGNSKMPYDYEIIQNVTGSPEDIFSLELLLKNYLIKNKLKYTPSKKFGGSIRECFKF